MFVALRFHHGQLRDLKVVAPGMPFTFSRFHANFSTAYDDTNSDNEEVDDYVNAINDRKQIVNDVIKTINNKKQKQKDVVPEKKISSINYEKVNNLLKNRVIPSPILKVKEDNTVPENKITTNKEMVTLNFPSKKNRRNDAPYINVGGKLIK